MRLISLSASSNGSQSNRIRDDSTPWQVLADIVNWTLWQCWLAPLMPEMMEFRLRKQFTKFAAQTPLMVRKLCLAVFGSASISHPISSNKPEALKAPESTLQLTACDFTELNFPMCGGLQLPAKPGAPLIMRLIRKKARLRRFA